MTPEFFWTIAIVSHLIVLVVAATAVSGGEIGDSEVSRAIRMLGTIGVIYTWVSVFV